jgi:uncharacterized membrane protein YbaN (DUF454 family)
MSKIKKALWYTLGMLCLGMSYVGFVTPGIPFSIFLVGAASCFAKSSEKMHAWLYNHPWFGEFLTNWTNMKVFPLRCKYAMVTVMSSTVMFAYIATGNIVAVLWSGGFMALVAVATWRYPSTVEEYNRRKEASKKIGWFK